MKFAVPVQIVYRTTKLTFVPVRRILLYRTEKSGIHVPVQIDLTLSTSSQKHITSEFITVRNRASIFYVSRSGESCHFAQMQNVGHWLHKMQVFQLQAAGTRRHSHWSSEFKYDNIHQQY